MIEMVTERKIRRKFGEKIFRRGLDYFREGRVISAVKMEGELIGTVSGTRNYRTEVGLEGLTCECSCPYQGRCKHGAALLLSYLEGKYEDGDKFVERVRQTSGEDLRNVVEKAVRSNPVLLTDFGPYLPERDEGVKDEEIESWIRKIEEQYWNEEAVSELSNFIKNRRKGLKKPQLFHILEFLFDNSGRWGWFYDDYGDRYFGDQLFESIGVAFGETGLGGEDVEKLDRMRKKDEMDYFSSLVQGMIENPEHVDPTVVEKFSTPQQLAEFHLNRRELAKAEKIIESGKFDSEGKFELLLRIDENKARDFAREEKVYAPLIRFLYKNGDENRIQELISEMSEGELRKLSREELDILFETCEDFRGKIFDVIYSRAQGEDRKSASYELCGDMALELEDVESSKEIFKRTSSGELKKRIVEFLRKKEPEEAEKYGKEAVSWIMENKKDYGPAVECIIMLRKAMRSEEWEDYLKDVYRENWRKRGLWDKLEDQGISLRKRKSEVYLEEGWTESQ